MAIISGAIWRAQEKRRKTMSGAVRQTAPGKFIKLRHGQTHYRLDGDPRHPLLVCIHGWSTASYVWEPLREPLRDKKYRLLTYDLYGRGYSDRPDLPHSAELFTTQLAELLSNLGLDRAAINVLGYSMGGAIAARFVSQRLDQVEKLALIAPAGMAVQLPGLRAFAKRNPKLVDSHLLALLPVVLRRQFKAEAGRARRNQDVFDIIQNQLSELDHKGYVPALLSSLNGVLSAQMEREHCDIARSSVAVRAVFADEDTTIPTPPAKQLFDTWNPNSVSRLIRGVGHSVTYTHPDEIMAEIDDFL
ncbi:MAG: alpha/beta hydrolase [Pseudomonadota bacterium]